MSLNYSVYCLLALTLNYLIMLAGKRLRTVEVNCMLIFLKCIICLFDNPQISSTTTAPPSDTLKIIFTEPLNSIRYLFLHGLFPRFALEGMEKTFLSLCLFNRAYFMYF